MITFKAGNLFTEPGLDGWAHGVNCMGVMGAGIAVEFRKRFPEMYESYRDLCVQGDLHPGMCYYWTEMQSHMPGDDMMVFNLATQEKWNATLGAIAQSVTEMLRYATDFGIKRIGMPAIGAGLGGLVWADVRAVLERVCADSDIEVVCFETFIP